MGYPVPLANEDSARVRYEYECTTRKVVEICAEHDNVKEMFGARRKKGLDLSSGHRSTF